MSYGKLFALAMILLAAAFFGGALLSQSSAPPASGQPDAKKEPSVKIVVYYFMTTTRCPSCYKIETYTHSTVMDKFSGELADGRMEWKMVNTDEKENAHYINDYQIFTKSVILSKVVDGKEVSWKNLDKVWQLLSDQQKFQKYIESEIREFIKEKK